MQNNLSLNINGKNVGLDGILTCVNLWYQRNIKVYNFDRCIQAKQKVL